MTRAVSDRWVKTLALYWFIDCVKAAKAFDAIGQNTIATKYWTAAYGFAVARWGQP